MAGYLMSRDAVVVEGARVIALDSLTTFAREYVHDNYPDQYDYEWAEGVIKTRVRGCSTYQDLVITARALDEHEDDLEDELLVIFNPVQMYAKL